MTQYMCKINIELFEIVRYSKYTCTWPVTLYFMAIFLVQLAILLFTLYMYCLTRCVTMVTGTCMHCFYLTCTQNKVTPVFIAAETGQVGALKTLISAGAKFNVANVVSIECVDFIHIVHTISHLEFKPGAKYRYRLVIVD